MYGMPEIAQEASPRTAPRARPARKPGTAREPSALPTWLQGQAINLTRHAAALRPFSRQEFGTGVATPSEGHLQAVNDLISALRADLLKMSKKVSDAVDAAVNEPHTSRLQQVVTLKERAHDRVRAIEKVWDFYFELFGQRQSRYGEWLVSCDRIALDCYQKAFMGIAVSRSIPAPPPFSYMRTGFSPATYRRGIPLRRLGRQMNPFPLIQLPYHRLVNPWTLGAILHEVCHNLHNDLGLARAVPRNIARSLLRAGYGRMVASVWARWNRETFADMGGLLLGGPAVVASLMDVVGRSPSSVLAYSARAPHPTPYLRTFISIELLGRMGFPHEAEEFRRSWTRIYPDPRAGNIPPQMLHNFQDAIAVVVDAICFQSYEELGNKSLSQVFSFGPKEQHMIEEAARRLAAGTDPGVVPERFMIGAARFAFENRLATPTDVAENFYKELSRR